ncbi:MAG: DnaJ domain-containing protein, partial [Deltaproteobacteria bacterium]|nr:DnaJ domain-containing protein [Deltaproteobacteria bacterium]
KASKPPPLGTRFQVNLLLPSDSMLTLVGRVTKQVGPGQFDGRAGPGVVLSLATLPHTAQWLIESSLASALKSGAISATESAAESTEELADDRELSDAESDLVATLENELGSLKKLNAFQLLEVEYTASDGEVRRAFATLTKRYHPDRFAQYQNERARAIGAEIYLLLRDAYASLSSAESRARTLEKSRATSKPPPVPARTPPIPLPKPKPKSPGGPTTLEPVTAAPPSSRLEKLLDASKFDAALTVANVEAKRVPGDKQARANVELCLALRALAQGDRMAAAEHFEATMELDPNNERAIRGVAEIRRQATEERKGFLGRLLQQKKKRNQ